MYVYVLKHSRMGQRGYISPSTHWFSLCLQVAATGHAGPHQSQGAKSPCGPPPWVTGTQAFGWGKGTRGKNGVYSFKWMSVNVGVCVYVYIIKYIEANLYV